MTDVSATLSWPILCKKKKKLIGFAPWVRVDGFQHFFPSSFLAAGDDGFKALPGFLVTGIRDCHSFLFGCRVLSTNEPEVEFGNISRFSPFCRNTCSSFWRRVTHQWAGGFPERQGAMRLKVRSLAMVIAALIALVRWFAFADAENISGSSVHCARRSPASICWVLKLPSIFHPLCVIWLVCSRTVHFCSLNVIYWWSDELSASLHTHHPWMRPTIDSDAAVRLRIDPLPLQMKVGFAPSLRIWSPSWSSRELRSSPRVSWHQSPHAADLALKSPATITGIEGSTALILSSSLWRRLENSTPVLFGDA